MKRNNVIYIFQGCFGKYLRGTPDTYVCESCGIHVKEGEIHTLKELKDFSLAESIGGDIDAYSTYESFNSAPYTEVESWWVTYNYFMSEGYPIRLATLEEYNTMRLAYYREYQEKNDKGEVHYEKRR